MEWVGQVVSSIADQQSSSVQIAAAASAVVVAGVSYVRNKRSRDELMASSDSAEVAALPRRKKHRKKKENVTVVDALKYAARRFPNDVVYTFLDDAGRESATMTNAELDQKARGIAYTLLQRGAKKGDRVILCYAPGLDFSAGFWGCLYAGVIAIPIYPPYPGRLEKDLPKFHKIVNDSGAQIVLTNKIYSITTKVASVTDYFTREADTTWPSHLTWISTDSIALSEGNKYVAVNVDMDDLAFFQYSSGSTSDPKAIMISYGNLRAQLKIWETIQPTDTMVSWLPSFHDMGLVGFTIVPVWTHCHCVSMSPISFIKKPTLWLQTASKYHATHICAPNFAYALAARKTTDAVRDTLDLSNLKQAICAAEPIRPESLDIFRLKFEPAGFDPKTFNCGYGLAEVTLVCTGQDPKSRKLPVVLQLDKRAIEEDKIAREAGPEDDVMVLVGCGAPAPTFELSIVDPDTCEPLEENRIGEIWVSGPSVATGYYGKPEMTQEAFHAELDGMKYLRTGDLGFLRDEQVFVTGRMKDLIIINGRNVAPQDVELSVEDAYDAVRPGCVATFSIERDLTECLVVVVELRNPMKDDKLQEAADAIQSRVLADHQLSCHAIALLFPRKIPKTTSGKIQRHMSKLCFEKGTLHAQKIFTFESKKRKSAAKKTSKSKKKSVASTTTTNSKTPAEVEEWLMAQLDVDDVDGETPWAAMGMDSVALVSLSADLGDWLGVVVPPAAFFEYTTPHALATAPGLATGNLKLQNVGVSEPSEMPDRDAPIPESSYKIECFPELQQLQGQMDQLNSAGLEIPYLDILTTKKRQMINYNTYNYVGLAGHPMVSAASKAAIDEYGTSMSSSPIVGQTEINRDLENELCSFFQSEAAVLFVGGWVSNVTTIDALVGPKDLILCDALNHNSCVVGQRLSGATVVQFPHNDVQQADRMLERIRHQYRRVLIVIEGVYSMDGDIPDLHAFVAMKKKHKAMLFLDEAHSFGTMGPTGRGLCEYSNVDPKDVDVRMGTMSKALGSTGGFILGSQALIQYLKYCAGGFVFSVGLTPANSASALASLKLIQKEPERVQRLQELSREFRDEAEKKGLDVGTVVPGSPVVVVHVGSTVECVTASMKLAQAGINVKPIVYPAVEEGKCRLRFFLSSLRTTQENMHTINTLAQEIL